MVSDPVGDFIVQLVNAGGARKESVSVPYSKLKGAIADVLVRTGYIKSATKRGKKVRKTLDVELAYQDGVHAIRGVKRVSKPGRRVYMCAEEIFPVKFGAGTLVLSTPAGILTGEEARTRHMGGEQLFIIW